MAASASSTTSLGEHFLRAAAQSAAWTPTHGAGETQHPLLARACGLESTWAPRRCSHVDTLGSSRKSSTVPIERDGGTNRQCSCAIAPSASADCRGWRARRPRCSPHRGATGAPSRAGVRQPGSLDFGRVRGVGRGVAVGREADLGRFHLRGRRRRGGRGRDPVVVVVGSWRGRVGGGGGAGGGSLQCMSVSSTSAPGPDRPRRRHGHVMSARREDVGQVERHERCAQIVEVRLRDRELVSTPSTVATIVTSTETGGSMFTPQVVNSPLGGGPEAPGSSAWAAGIPEMTPNRADGNRRRPASNSRCERTNVCHSRDWWMH